MMRGRRVPRAFTVGGREESRVSPVPAAPPVLARAQPEVGLLILSNSDDDEYVDRLLALRSTGRGYTLKNNPEGLTGLVEAVRRVGAGRNHLDDAIQNRLAVRAARGAGEPRPPDNPLQRLSPDDRRVLHLISAESLTNAAIAAIAAIARRLNRRPNTIDKQISRIFQKQRFDLRGVTPTRRMPVSSELECVMSLCRDSMVGIRLDGWHIDHMS